jgi:hypothetical protein
VVTGEIIIVVSIKFLGNYFIGNGHFYFWHTESTVQDIFELEASKGVILDKINDLFSEWTVLYVFPNDCSSLILREFSEVSHSQLLSILHPQDSFFILIVFDLELFTEIRAFDELKIANVVTSFIDEFACVLGEI